MELTLLEEVSVTEATESMAALQAASPSSSPLLLLLLRLSPPIWRLSGVFLCVSNCVFCYTFEPSDSHFKIFAVLPNSESRFYFTHLSSRINHLEVKHDQRNYINKETFCCDYMYFLSLCLPSTYHLRATQ